MKNNTQPSDRTEVYPPYKKFKKKSKMKRKKTVESMNNEPDTKKQPVKVLSSNWQAFLQEVNAEKQKSSNQQHGPKTPKRKRPVNSLLEKNSEKRAKLEKAEEKESNTIKREDIWFDDVDIDDIETATGKKFVSDDKKSESITAETTMQTNGFTSSITKRLAIDCEMVGVGIEGKDNMLGRVSIVNSFGETVYDTFVAPMQKVADYRTEFSGIRPEDLVNAPPFTEVQKQVADLTNCKILVGHAVHNDLKVLMLSHPRKDIRDTSSYKPFKKLLKTRYPSLKKLSKEILNVDIQSGEHSSVEDARMTMKIYQLHKRQWERSIKDKGYKTTIDKTPLIFTNKESKEDRRKRLRSIRDRKKNKTKKP
eukprot:gene12785-3519_t